MFFGKNKKKRSGILKSIYLQNKLYKKFIYFYNHENIYIKYNTKLFIIQLKIVFTLTFPILAIYFGRYILESKPLYNKSLWNRYVWFFKFLWLKSR